jgi:hypothetical protein
MVRQNETLHALFSTASAAEIIEQLADQRFAAFRTALDEFL